VCYGRTGPNKRIKNDTPNDEMERWKKMDDIVVSTGRRSLSHSAAKKTRSFSNRSEDFFKLLKFSLDATFSKLITPFKAKARSSAQLLPFFYYYYYYFPRSLRRASFIFWSKECQRVPLDFAFFVYCIE
jgi:hypothetical protein